MTTSRLSWAALALPLLALPGGAAEVAILKSAEAAAWRPALDAVKRVASAHTITEYDLRNDRAEADRVIGGLKTRPVILVAFGPLAAQAAREQAPEHTTLYAMVIDPARHGLTGANVAGVAAAIPVKNQLAAFRLVNPRGTKIGVVYTEDGAGKQVQEGLKAAPLVRVNVVAKPVASDREVPAAVRALLSGPEAVDALWVPFDVGLADESRRFIMTESLKSGKAVYGFGASMVQQGALVSNAPDVTSIGEQLGELVNRVASGEKSRIETLIPRAELVINKKIADKLKIEVPADALKAASKVF